MVDIVSSIAPLAKGRKGWLVDIWGVIHNGVQPFQSAVKACRTFREEHGGRVILLSNAPRPNEAVAAQLARLGVAPQAYDGILTSGDICRQLMAVFEGQPVYHIGPDRDAGLFEGLSIERVSPGEAQGVICSGLFDDENETARDYLKPLTALAARNIPMVCANPDLTVERGGRIIPCAGAVAALYEELSGHVAYAGKPYLPIYEAAFALLDKLTGHPLDPDQILAIGDGVNTDITGAASAGIDSVYIASNVNLEGAGFDAKSLGKLFPSAAVRPRAAMAELAW